MVVVALQQHTLKKIKKVYTYTQQQLEGVKTHESESSAETKVCEDTRGGDVPGNKAVSLQPVLLFNPSTPLRPTHLLALPPTVRFRME